jgi:hypothetical protein
MAAARTIGFLLVLATAACASVESTPAREPAATATKPGADVAAEPASAAASEPAAPPKGAGAPNKPVADQPAPVAVQPAAVAQEPVAPPPVTPRANEKAASASPATKAPAKVAASPAPKAPAAKTAAAAPAPEKPAAPPPLDLGALEKRLKETDAIGVMTKLTLKNQVDDLVGRFRAYYAGRAKTTLAELRQPYDLLILKVLTLLQDGDPSLASAIRSSREAIWGILSDPEKFSKLAS